MNRTKLALLSPCLIVLLGTSGPRNCAHEVQRDFEALAARVDSLEAQVEDLEADLAKAQALLQFVHVEPGELEGLAGPHWVIEGANVHVRSGSGTTYEGCTSEDPVCLGLSGLGNLVIGYNEPRVIFAPLEEVGRTGSHNLVVGPGHGYTSIGGLVAGNNNAATAISAATTGGFNLASGAVSSVGGGAYNVSDGLGAAVVGGIYNEATGDYSAVSGGSQNLASGLQSWIGSGALNETTASGTSVSGGSENVASGAGASVSGGSGNVAGGRLSSVSGGLNRNAPDENNWAAGSLVEPE